MPRRSSGMFFVLAVVGIWLAVSTGEPASAETKRYASSVCEAQELKALAEQDPHLEIEIPPEYDKPFPTLAACRSHAAAWDPAAKGPQQPIPFSHKHHSGDWGIDCVYCHTGTDRSRMAGVPSVELCMGCHEQFPAEYDELEGIQILKQYWAEQKSIPWTQIHRLPEHVKFQHQAHVRVGFDCQTCHGQVQEFDKLYMTPDTRFWPYGLPTKKLEMGWCVLCHRDNGASQDCLTCHY